MDVYDIARRDPLVVVGIDPGTAVLGFGVVGRRKHQLVAIDHGVFRPPKSLDVGGRLVFLNGALGRLLDHHRPDLLSLEEAFVHKNVQSALRIGEARAVVLLAAAGRDIPVLQYPTATAKKSVCGHGGATKELVQEMVQRQLGLDALPTPHDAADGLALALCLLADPRIDPRFAAASGSA